MPNVQGSIEHGQQEDVKSTVIPVGSSGAVEVRGTAERHAMLLKNNSSVDIYLGGSNVSTANGYPLTAGEVLPVDLGQRGRIFAIAESGSGNDLRILEV